MDPVTAITVAGIAFLGVLIGGIITAGTNFILAVRKEAVDAAKDRKIYASEVLKASRLILLELSEAESTVEQCIQRKEWTFAADFKTEAWGSYKAILAPELTFAEWSQISLAFVTTHGLSTAPFSLLQELKDREVGQLITLRQEIERGIAALRPYTEIVPPVEKKPGRVRDR
jgi:hypothetical protein